MSKVQVRTITNDITQVLVDLARNNGWEVWHEILQNPDKERPFLVIYKNRGIVDWNSEKYENANPLISIEEAIQILSKPPKKQKPLLKCGSHTVRFIENDIVNNVFINNNIRLSYDDIDEIHKIIHQND